MRCQSRGEPVPDDPRAPELSTREVAVLRLLADGFDTAEVARALCWSERTVKNAVHDITTRLRLRNRTHAVAYALRRGLI
jgi:DNA-binding NarL/FixJ family response regulator